MKLKTLLCLGGIVVILSLIPSGILFYQNQQLKEQISSYAGNLDINHKNLTKSLQRAETKLANSSKELELFAQQNKIDLQTIQDDIYSLNGRLEAISVTTAQTTTITTKNQSSDSSVLSDSDIPTCKSDGRPIDIYGYTKRIETKHLSDSNGMRVADVSFAAGEKRPWSSKIWGIEYKILNTVSRGSNNQVILHTELTAENPEVQPGKIFQIEGIESRVLQAPELPTQFDWWDPTLYLAGQLALNVYPEINFSASISLGFSVWSYGPNWKFLALTAGYDAFNNTFRASLIPVLYNVGGPAPFLEDLFIFFDIGIDSEGSVGIGFGLATRI